MALDVQDDPQKSDGCIVMLIMAPREISWEIALELVNGVDEAKLDFVGAGPLEEVLAKFGDDLIDRVEAEAALNPKFRRALSNVWQNTMSDEVYARVRRAAS